MSEVELEDRGSRRRYVIRGPKGEAELALTVLPPQKIIADHTLVLKALHGQGFRDRLLGALLEGARAKGFTIIPLCPFVASRARRHPERAELFATP